MSQENVEVVRGLIAAINQIGQVVLRPLHADIKWHLDSDHPDQTVLDGHDDVAAYFREWRDAFDRVRMDASEYIDQKEPAAVEIERRDGNDVETVWSYSRERAEAESEKKSVVETFGFDPARWDVRT